MGSDVHVGMVVTSHNDGNFNGSSLPRRLAEQA